MRSSSDDDAPRSQHPMDPRDERLILAFAPSSLPAVMGAVDRIAGANHHAQAGRSKVPAIPLVGDSQHHKWLMRDLGGIEKLERQD